MLLSMFISFLLARKFKGKIYVLLMTVFLIFVSLFSIGFPSVWGTLEGEWFPREGVTIWQLNLPAIPFSFPFCVSISEEYHIIHYLKAIYDYASPPLYHIELYFLTNHIWANDYVHWFLTSEHVILLVSSVFLINFAGAIFGYWISKTTFIDRLLKKG